MQGRPGGVPARLPARRRGGDRTGAAQQGRCARAFEIEGCGGRGRLARRDGREHGDGRAGRPLLLDVPAHGVRVLLRTSRVQDAGLRRRLDRAMAARETAQDGERAPQEARTTSSGAISVDSTARPSTRRIRFSTSSSPARRVSCRTVVSGGLKSAAGDDVVEADHRDVLGHAHAAVLERVDRADGDQVAGGEHGVELHAALEQRDAGRSPRPRGSAPRPAARAAARVPPSRARRRSRDGEAGTPANPPRRRRRTRCGAGPGAGGARSRGVRRERCRSTTECPGCPSTTGPQITKCDSVFDQLLQALRVLQVVAVAEQDHAVGAVRELRSRCASRPRAAGTTSGGRSCAARAARVM